MAIPAKARNHLLKTLSDSKTLSKRIKRDEANESNTADVIRDLLQTC